jgi:hypothetical protein
MYILFLVPQCPVFPSGEQSKGNLNQRDNKTIEFDRCKRNNVLNGTVAKSYIFASHWSGVRRQFTDKQSFANNKIEMQMHLCPTIAIFDIFWGGKS